MTTFFYSDPHWYHHNVIEFSKRPFKDIHHMNSALIANYKKTVSEGDTVFWLGDVVLCKRDTAMQRVKGLLEKLPGDKILVPGNHDDPRIYKFFNEFHSAILHTFEGLGDTLMVHHPVGEANLRDVDKRYGPVYCNEGRWNTAYNKLDTILCGHVHNTWADGVKLMGKNLYVGVDLWNYAPVSLEELIQYKKEHMT